MVTTQVDFGEVHFGRADLGDQRRRKRLIQLANKIVKHPEGSLPNKLQDPAAYQAMYRLCKNRRVTHEAVLETHRRVTLEKMGQCENTVLILHDTTELDYTSIESLHDELGQIGDGGGRGYECHHSLAASDASGEVLGLANQILHKRAEVPKNEGVAAKREREDRESLLWLKGCEAVGSAPEGCHWVDVCDRGADTFELLDFEDREKRHYVIRSNYNRSIYVGDGDRSQRALLHEYVRTLPPLGGRVVDVPPRDGQPARRAKCLVTVAAVQIRPPHVKRGHHRQEPLFVWVIRVWEVDPPPGVREPLEWILLTNIPTESLTDACRRIGWYEKRWIVEDYHKAQKTGCGIEELQFQSADRLEPMIALLSVVAVMVLNLRVASRGNNAQSTPATRVVPTPHVAVLSVWRYKQRRLDLSIHDFYYALARLGGHQNRSSDGPPGWITLWRGWHKLQQMVDYALAAGVERCD